MKRTRSTKEYEKELAAERAELVRQLKIINQTEESYSQILAWKQVVTRLDLLDTRVEELKEAYEKGYKIGVAQGKLNVKVAEEIDVIKTAIRHKAPISLIDQLKFLNHEKIKSDLEFNLDYILEHPKDSSYEICDALGLVEALFDESTVQT